MLPLVLAMALAAPTLVPADGVVSLDGTWDGRLSDEGGTSDAGEWRATQVPGNFRFQGIEYEGVAWLKTSFVVTDASKDYAVRVPPAANAYELFVNGQLLGGRGVIGPSGELVEKDFRSQVIRVPKELLRANEPASLAVRIRTFYGNAGILSSGVLFGPETLVRDETVSALVRVSALVSLFFFASFFHVLLYLGRRRERHYLSFAFLTLQLATITTGINMLGYVVSSSSDFNAYLVFVPLLVLPVAFVGFFSDFFGRSAVWPKRVTTAFALVGLATLMSSTAHHPVYPFFERVVLPVTVMLLAGAIIVSTWWTMQAFLRGIRGARAILIGLGVYAATGLVELAWTFSLVPFRFDSYLGFAFFIGAMVVAISERFAQLHHQAELGERDALTGCLTRHGFLERLPGLLATKGPVSCLLFDLDHFKNINDSLGHLAGDQVLASTGDVVRGVMRADDVVVRWGGEEFLVVLPGSTQAVAAEVAARLQAALARQQKGAVTFTASFGVAGRLENEGFEPWVGRADLALYAAKQAGRNCIRVAP